MPVTLRAHPQAGEILRDGCDRRPHVTVYDQDDDDNDFPLFLGRNSVTQIADPAVSRRVCQISLSPQEGWLTVENIKSMVWVNAHILRTGMKQTLQQGDVVRLPPTGKYSYVVEYPAGHAMPPPAQAPALPLLVLPDAVGSSLTTTSATTTATLMTSPSRRKRTTPTTMTTTPSSPHPQQLQQQLLLPVEVREELYCPLCLDLQVRSTVLVPCGHNFCRACIAGNSSSNSSSSNNNNSTSSSLKECPICRETVASQVPNRAMDNIIHGLVVQQEQQQQQHNNNHGAAAAAAAAADDASFGGGCSLPPDDVANYQQRTTYKHHHHHHKKNSNNKKKSSSSRGGSSNKKRRRTHYYGRSVNDVICIDE